MLFFMRFEVLEAKEKITPTAVIKQIDLLDANLGVKLFDRIHRGLTLTKAGVSLYHDARI